MYKWKKSFRMDEVAYNIRGPLLDKAYQLENQGIKVLKLNIGNTYPFGLEMAPPVLDAMTRNIPQSQGYEHSKGVLSAREAISEYYAHRNISVGVEDIFIGNGVSELINVSMKALLNKGDEVLVPTPDYPLWTATVRLCDGVAVHYHCDEDNAWNPDISDIKKKITDNTKAIVVINPNNPTGALYDRDVLLEIIRIAQENNILIYADEIYERIIYDGHSMNYMASLVKDYPCIFFNGLSKSFRAPGFRSGWMCISDPLNQLENYKGAIHTLSNMRLCSNVISQWGIIEALTNDNSIEDLVSPQGRLYQQRKIVYDAIESIEGMSAVLPKGALYIFPKLDKKKFNLHDDNAMALELLNKEHILIMPGTAFNYPDCDHIRIVYLPKPDDLSTAMNKMAYFFQSYTQ